MRKGNFRIEKMKLDVERDYRLTLIGYEYLEKKYGNVQAAIAALTYTESVQDLDEQGNIVPVVKMFVKQGVLLDFLFAGILHNDDAHTEVGAEIVPNYEIRTKIAKIIDVQNVDDYAKIVMGAITGSLPDSEEEAPAEADPQ